MALKWPHLKMKFFLPIFTLSNSSTIFDKCHFNLSIYVQKGIFWRFNELSKLIGSKVCPQCETFFVANLDHRARTFFGDNFTSKFRWFFLRENQDEMVLYDRSKPYESFRPSNDWFQALNIAKIDFAAKTVIFGFFPPRYYTTFWRFWPILVLLYMTGI